MKDLSYSLNYLSIGYKNMVFIDFVLFSVPTLEVPHPIEGSYPVSASGPDLPPPPGNINLRALNIIVFSRSKIKTDFN